MQTVELTAKSVEDARKLAAEKLKVDVSEVAVIVLEESKGLFGKTQVRVRCEAAEPVSAIKETPAEVRNDVVETVEPKAEEMKKEPRRTLKRPKKEAEKDEPADAAPASPAAPEAAPAKPERRGRDDRESREEQDDRVATEEDAENLVELLRELLEAAAVEVDVDVNEISGKYVNIQLGGKDAAFLVGKHGEVINALQYLLNIVAARRYGNGIRATLDANDYRRRREESLTKLASKIAAQVLERQEEAVLDALPAFERRVVHKALSVIEGISTYSEGEEPNRRVVIAPGN